MPFAVDAALAAVSQAAVDDAFDHRRPIASSPSPWEPDSVCFIWNLSFFYFRKIRSYKKDVTRGRSTVLGGDEVGGRWARMSVRPAFRSRRCSMLVNRSLLLGLVATKPVATGMH